MPADEGATFLRAIMRRMHQLPVLPQDPRCIEARRADALMGLASAQIAADPDPDRATIVLHTTPEALASEAPAGLEGGGVIDGPTLGRLSCDAGSRPCWRTPRAMRSALGA